MHRMEYGKEEFQLKFVRVALLIVAALFVGALFVLLRLFGFLPTPGFLYGINILLAILALLLIVNRRPVRGQCPYDWRCLILTAFASLGANILALVIQVNPLFNLVLLFFAALFGILLFVKGFLTFRRLFRYGG